MRIPQSLRRIAVLAMYGAYIAGAVMQWRVQTFGEDRQLILSLFIVSFTIGALLFATTRYMSWSSAKDATLDEREIATRNDTYRQAYRMVAWCSIALLAIWYAMPLMEKPLAPQTAGNVLFWGYVLLISTLPASLLAWKDRPAA